MSMDLPGLQNWKIFGAVLVLTVSSVTAAGEKTLFTCEAGHFVAGHNASITCNFHRDVSELENYHYYVEWFPFDVNQPSEEVLACFRVESGKLVCREKPGFHFNGTVNDRLTIEIPNVSARFAGRYTCQYVPPDGKKVEMCSLTVEGVMPVTPTKKTTSVSETKTTSGKGEDNDTAVICISVILGLICVGQFCLILFLVLRGRRKEQNSPGLPENTGLVSVSNGRATHDTSPQDH